MLKVPAAMSFTPEHHSILQLMLSTCMSAPVCRVIADLGDKLDKYTSNAAQCGQGFSSKELKELKDACMSSVKAAAAGVKEVLPSVLGPLLALAVPVLEQGYAEGAQQESPGLTPALFKLESAMMEALAKVHSLCDGLSAEVLPLALRILAAQAKYLYVANTSQVHHHLSSAQQAAATQEAALAAAGALSEEVPQQQPQAAPAVASAPRGDRSEAALPSASAEVASEAVQAGSSGAAAEKGLEGEAGGDGAAATPASTGSPASEAAASSAKPQSDVPLPLSPAEAARQAAQADFAMVMQAIHRQASGAVKEAQAAAQRLATHGVAYSAQQLVAAQQELNQIQALLPPKQEPAAPAT
jgi:hypothetical protein